MDSCVTWMSRVGFGQSFAQPSSETSALPIDWSSLGMNSAARLPSPSLVPARIGRPQRLHTDFAIMRVWNRTRFSLLISRNNAHGYVKRCTTLVVDHTPRVELWFVRPFPLFPAVNATVDGVDGTPDGFLDEVCREISFLAETVVQRISGFPIRGDTILVVGVVPAVVTGLVRAVEELVGGFVEVVVIFVRNDELDGCSTSDLYNSGLKPSVLDSSGVSWLQSRRLCRRVSASARGLCPLTRPEARSASLSSPAYSLRASGQSEALAS